MDPNETLKRLRQAVLDVRGLVDNEPIDADALAHAASDLHDAADAIDGWLSRGGFLPDAWGGTR